MSRCYLGELMSNKANARFFSTSRVGPEVLRGANINRYILLGEAKQGESLYLREAEFQRSHQRDARIAHHEYEKVGFQQSSPIDNWRRVIACHIPAGHYCKETVQYFTETDCSYDLYTLLALFNSALIEWRFGLTSTNNHVNKYEIEKLPIPRFECLDRESYERKRPQRSWELLLAKDGEDSIVPWEQAVAADIRATSREADTWPDSIHDALSASGKELTRLRESRKVLVDGFAEWLFTTLRVDREKFASWSRLQGSQADVDKQDWDWLRGLLGRSRNACGVDPLLKESEIRITYGHFVEQVRESNAKFEALEQATDRVVWQLVGLNPDGSVPPNW